MLGGRIQDDTPLDTSHDKIDALKEFGYKPTHVILAVDAILDALPGGADILRSRLYSLSTKLMEKYSNKLSRSLLREYSCSPVIKSQTPSFEEREGNLSFGCQLASRPPLLNRGMSSEIVSIRRKPWRVPAESPRKFPHGCTSKESPPRPQHPRRAGI